MQNKFGLHIIAFEEGIKSVLEKSYSGIPD